jgi:hypothetical protein
VRGLAKAKAPHSDVLAACDAVRDGACVDLGVRLEDRPDGGRMDGARFLFLAGAAGGRDQAGGTAAVAVSIVRSARGLEKSESGVWRPQRQVLGLGFLGVLMPHAWKLMGCGLGVRGWCPLMRIQKGAHGAFGRVHVASACFNHEMGSLWGFGQWGCRV